MHTKSMLGQFGRVSLALWGGLVLISGCSSELSEEKARAAADRARDSIKPLDHGAMEQRIPPETVKKVQEELIVLKEYMGPVTGKLDVVTLNALEAFQRSQGILADGQFNDRTLQALEQVAQQAKG